MLPHGLADEHLVFMANLDDRPRREAIGAAEGPDEQTLVDERRRRPASRDRDHRVRAAGEPAAAEAGGRARRSDDDSSVDPHATGRGDAGHVERATDEDRGHKRELGPWRGRAIERDPVIVVQRRDRAFELDLERGQLVDLDRPAGAAGIATRFQPHAPPQLELVAAIVTRRHLETRAEAAGEGLGVAEANFPGQFRDRDLAGQQQERPAFEPQPLDKRAGRLGDGLSEHAVEMKPRQPRRPCQVVQADWLAEQPFGGVHRAHDGLG